MAILAGIALVALVATAIWRVSGSVRAASMYAENAQPTAVAHPDAGVTWQKDLLNVASGTPEQPASGDADGLGNIGSNVVASLASSYAAMRETGGFTTQRGEQAADNVANSLEAQVSHQSYAATDFKTDPDTSYQRMLTYRDDMRTALAPLLKNNDYELKLFANYIGSGDRTYLDQLQAEVANYRAAIANAATVVVPADLLSYHVGIENALAGFASTLDAMIAHADDPFASAALLRTYQSNERAMIDAFNALAQYERVQKPSS